MKMGRVFLTFLALTLILAVLITIKIVPGFDDLSNPNSMAMASAFALIFALVCFLPVILLADISGIIFVLKYKNTEYHHKVLWFLLVGNSLVFLITVMITLNSIIVNSNQYGAAAVFKDLSQSDGLFQGLLIFLGPTLATLFACIYWLLKRKSNPPVFEKDEVT